MKIGILSKPSKDFFNNGCNQQSIFVYETINNIPGYECFIVTGSDDNYLNFMTINFSKNYNKIKTLDIIIFLSAEIHDEKILKQLKSDKIQLILYNCGNYYYIYQEDIIFNSHNSIKNRIKDNYIYKYFDEYWCIPNYTKDKYFYETLYDLKFKTVPYVWNNTVIKDYPDITYNPLKTGNDIKHFLIMEPNVQITKTCLIPLLICERLYKQGFVNIRVMVLCKPNTEAFKVFIESLEIYKNNKVELYSRIKYFDVIKQLNNKNIDFYVISNHRDNALNFLHLETLYLGYPLIHNCEYYKEAGYYYNNIKEGAEKLLFSIKNHKNIISQYTAETKKTLFKFSPNNPSNMTLHKYLLDNIHN